MRSISLLAFATAALVPALAQNISETSTVVQSPDFNLVIISDNSTLNGSLLTGCHNGAAHESLCILGDNNSTLSYNEFQFNYTVNTCTETNSTGTYVIPCSDIPTDPTLVTGIVTWWLPYTGEDGPAEVSQAVGLEFPTYTNVAQMSIGFEDDYTYVAFDKDSLLNIQTYLDDTLEPASELLPATVALYRWYICKTYYTGYQYTALTWVMGGGAPQNPTCQKVDVKRVWV